MSSLTLKNLKIVAVYPVLLSFFDLVLLGGGTFTDATFSYANANDGSIDISGNQTISYTGLEPISSTITATNVTLDYSTTAETITVTDPGSSQTTVNSTAGEVTTFNSPSGTFF